MSILNSEQVARSSASPSSVFLHYQKVAQNSQSSRSKELCDLGDLCASIVVPFRGVLDIMLLK
jgi:hypothetical protein